MPMIEAGRVFLFFALVAASGALLSGIFSAKAGDADLSMKLGLVARRALFSSFLLTVCSAALFLHALITHNFEIAYVWQHTSSSLPLVYRFSAFWAGQEGSLLFWVLTLLACGVLAVRIHGDDLPALMPIVVAAVAATAILFLYLLVAVVPPFATIAEHFPDAPVGTFPEEGFGLNPLLQNPGMVVHPPLLLLGYVGFAIPFAFAVAALIKKRVDASWLKATRRWSILSWLFLSLGILLGAKWAYVELGWGGYWAWDPVENASFIPWLTATAYIHSVMIEERRGMFRAWNMILIALTFFLCIFGTFLTRSGILSSVHSFSGSGVGGYFGGFLIVGAVFTAVLIYTRRGVLKGENRIESFVSREAAFLFNNVILVSMAFAVLWGTLYPIISEYATGERASVGPPFFNKVLLPLSLVLYFLTGLGPVLAWRRASPEGLLRHLALPGLGAFTASFLLYAFGLRPLSAVIGIGLAVFVIAISAYDHILAAQIRSKNTGDALILSAWVLLRRNGRRYGGYLVHVGIAVLFIGVLGSFYNLESTASLGIGDKVEVGEFQLTLDRLDEFSEKNRDVLSARLNVTEDGRAAGSVAPEISMFRGTGEEQRASEVDILQRFTGDLYVSLISLDQAGRAVVQVRWNALVGWVWIGSGLLVLGCIFALLPAPRRVKAAAHQPSSSRISGGTHVTATIAVVVLTLSCAAASLATVSEASVTAIASNLTCQCGCSMNLATCSHATCSGRDHMKSQIASMLGDGLSKPEILAKMETEYGKIVLAAPPARGFDIAAWVAPFAVVLFAAGFGAVLLRRWKVQSSNFGLSDSHLPSPVDEQTAAAVQDALKEYR